MNDETIELLRALVGEGCPVDNMEHCHYCHEAGVYVGGRYRERHADDCPYLRARQLVERYDAARAATRQAIGGGI